MTAQRNERPVSRSVPRRPPRVVARERQLFGEERLPLLGRTHTDQEREDGGAFGDRQLVVGCARGGMGVPGVCGDTAGFFLLVWSETSARDQQLGLIGCQLGAQERKIACPVRHCAEEGMHVRRGEGPFQPRPLLRGRSARCTAPVPPMTSLIPTHCRQAYEEAATSVRSSLRDQVAAQPRMCFASSAIWLLTSTVRGSVSIAAANVSAVQRSSDSTLSAIDHPP